MTRSVQALSYRRPSALRSSQAGGLLGRVSTELAGAADLLAAVHHAAAVELFGGLFEPVPRSQPYEERLPPTPVARPLDAAPATVAELVVDVAAVVNAASWDTPAFERALDGLVRLARTDREELSRGLREALVGSWFLPVDDSEQRFRPAVRSPQGLAVVVSSLLGDVPDLVAAKGAARHASLSASASAPCAHAALDDVLAARLWEAGAFVRTGAVPFLLATPPGTRVRWTRARWSNGCGRTTAWAWNPARRISHRHCSGCAGPVTLQPPTRRSHSARLRATGSPPGYARTSPWRPWSPTARAAGGRRYATGGAAR